MRTLNKKYVISILVGFITLSLTIILTINNAGSKLAMPTPELQSKKNEPDLLGSNIKTVHQKEISTSEKKSFTQADTHDFFSWMSTRGHFSKEERQDYEHYSTKTLEDLAESGDLKALDALGDLYLHSGDVKKAASYYNKGAIRGSTLAIEILGVMAEPGYSLDESERRVAALESLAIRKVLALRGDEARAELETDALIQSYDRLFNKKLEITPEDQQHIDKRAQEIYNDWQEKRRELGLNDFDNSQPLGVTKFFNFFKKAVTTN